MGCCGGRKKQITPSNRTPIPNKRPQIARRCPRCTWPMGEYKRYDHAKKIHVRIWVCLNRLCRHKISG